MIAKYQTGYSIPKNVLQALRYVGKIGVLSTQDWHQFFGNDKKIRWQQKQLKYLIDHDYLRKHSATSFRGKWILGENGKKLLEELNCMAVHPTWAHQVDHDEYVGRSMLMLENAKLITSWMSASELAKSNQDKYQLTRKDGDQKFPDALFDVFLHNQKKTVAIEYERNGKSQTRYRSILWNYAGLGQISLILFICENKTIQRRIEETFLYLKMPELLDRLATTSAVEWKKSPMEAPLKMNRGIIRLKDVCNEIEQKIAS